MCVKYSLQESGCPYCMDQLPQTTATSPVSALEALLGARSDSKLEVKRLSPLVRSTAAKLLILRLESCTKYKLS